MINSTLAIVTLLSLVVAAIASVVAWMTKREERRRAEARVALLAAAIHERGDDLPLRQRASAGATPALFVEPAGSPGTRLAAMGVVAVLAVGAITGLVLMAEGGSRGTRRGPESAHVVQPAPGSLELVALEHDRDDSRLVVRGIVRNPASAVTIKGLTAVVLVFSRDGGFIASGRAPAAIAALAPGAETPFVVTLPDADSVDRYRVSFRTGDRIVPHVDRRGRNAIARTE
jgi:predicted permease